MEIRTKLIFKTFGRNMSLIPKPHGEMIPRILKKNFKCMLKYCGANCQQIFIQQKKRYLQLQGS